jgi:hypothetical protein
MFSVSERIDVQGGKPDADFVRYVIKRKHGRSSLELLFGVVADDPYDDRFIDSIDFAQRLLLLPNKGVGLDSRGHSRGGRSWRYTAIYGEVAADYKRAFSEDAVVFDQVIDSMCYVPYPSK